MDALLTWHGDPPSLRSPVLLAALDGFVDAGAVAMTAAMFLRHRWQAELAGTFDRDALIDYRARRPTAVVDGGELRRVDWPGVELYAAQPGGAHDVVFLLGPEPDMRWQAFFVEVADACERLQVEAVIGLGAYPAAVPHTRAVNVVRAGNAPARDLFPQARDVVGYTGPIGAGTALHAALADRAIPAVGLWAEVPHYVAGSPNPAGALALVHVVTSYLGVEVDSTELEAAAKLHGEQVDEAVRDYPEAREMIQALERHVDAGGGEEVLPTGEDIAAEIERFLRGNSP